MVNTPHAKTCGKRDWIARNIIEKEVSALQSNTSPIELLPRCSSLFDLEIGIPYRRWRETEAEKKSAISRMMMRAGTTICDMVIVAKDIAAIEEKFV